MQRRVSLLIGFTVLISAAFSHSSRAEDDVVKRFQEKTFTFTGGIYKDHPFKYRLLKPVKIEPGKTYPLVLFLHGAGERGSDNVKQLKFLPTWLSEPGMAERYPCFMLVPQCPEERRWGSLDWKKDIKSYSAEPVEETKYLLALVEHTMKDLPIDPSRVYLTGLSMGGYGSWELATRKPELWTAVAPICGAGDPKHAAALTALPIWTWHGDADKAVPVDRSREMVAAIKAAGGTKIQYTELPGVGHNSWTPAYQQPDGVVPWLFKQRKK